MSIDDNISKEFKKRFEHPFIDENSDFSSYSDLLFLSNISPEEAIKYNKRFNGKDIVEFVKAYISAEQANQYNKRFLGNDVVELVKANVSSRRANKYDIRFDGRDIVAFVKTRISAEKANRYNKRRYGYEIIDMSSANVLPELANEYNRFKSWDIVDLAVAGISPEQANKYNRRRFYGFEIVELAEAGVSSILADKYNKRFEGWEIADLSRVGVSPEQADAYIKEFDGTSIALLHIMGIRPKNMTINKQKKFYKILSEIVEFEDIKEHPFNYSFVDTGSSAVILLKKDKRCAWKISEDVEEEVSLLMNLNKPKHVIKIKECIDGRIINIEYISGRSLEENIKKGKPLFKTKVIKYSHHIFKGLQELKSAGIYHRDIRPSNIMIDEEKDRAIIIDLGIATDDPNAMPKDNRRYGGSDLMSLGQLIYKMATGHNLFNEYARNSFEAAGDIQKLRNRFCEDEKIRNHFMDKVSNAVKNKTLADAINTCLTAGLKLGNKQNSTPTEIREEAYDQVKQMFERYAKS